MSKFFINRPIVAMVISILMVIVGLVAMSGLPTAQFPNIVPPEMQVKGTYPGADALTVEQSVATPIEQQMSGVDNMNYMYSLNANDGSMKLTVNFDIKTDPNTDQILSQMRSNQANSQLPSDVINQGVTVQKSTSSPLIMFALFSPNGTYDNVFLANYCYININDQMTRVPGIASVTVFGAGQYAMRLWVRPDLLASLGITIPEIVTAVQQQNTVNPSGQVGGEPVPQGQEFTYAVRSQGRLENEKEFGNIVIRANADGSLVRVKDVGRIELGAQSYSMIGRLNGKPAALIALYQLPGTNAIEAADGAKKVMADLKERFPADLDYVVALDTTLAVTEGIKEIIKTLYEALILVIIVVFIFLQGWRATLIPLLAVPVSLVGTFVFFPLLGLFDQHALALRSGACHRACRRRRHRRRRGRGAPHRARDVPEGRNPEGHGGGLGPRHRHRHHPGGRVRADGLHPGHHGAALPAVRRDDRRLRHHLGLQRPHALAGPVGHAAEAEEEILGPAAEILRRVQPHLRPLDGRVRELVRPSHPQEQDEPPVPCSATAVLAGFFGKHLPVSFLPDEDQGFVYAGLQLPDAASLQRTDAVTKKAEEIIMKTPGVKYCTTVVGYSMLSGVSNTYSSFFFITLEEWAARKKPEEQYEAIKDNLNRELRGLTEAIAFAFPPPAIPGVGTSGGATFVLEDRSGKDIAFLAEQTNKFLDAARKRPELAGLSTTFRPTVPQVFVEVDRDKVLKQGVALTDVYKTLQCFMGGAFVNYFNRFGRQWQIYVQAEGQFRTKAQNLGQFRVRNNAGQMVPLSAVTSVRATAGPEFTMRYNLYRSAQINASAAPGYSSAQAMEALEQVFAETMPGEMGYDYMGMSYQEKKAQEGVSPAVIFAFSLLCVFLILAAQYESWSLPFSVLLGTPIAVMGAFFALWLLRYENNVYAQIGLVMLIGLAAKNAILIVEFAKMEYDKGKPVLEAALTGAKLRLRPILMTSFAFILGCVPLALASGAGAISRRVMGMTVIGGMLAASFIAIFLIPVTFYVVEKLTHGGKTGEHAPAEQTKKEGDSHE